MMNPSTIAKPRPSESEAFDLPLGLARQSLYRFAALLVADPRYGAWERLSDPATAAVAIEAAAILRSDPTAEVHPLGLGEGPLADLNPVAVLEKLPRSPAAFNAAYEQTFGLLVSGNCPPYETEYVNSKFTFQRSQGLADIAGFYRAFGLEPSTMHPERHDHVALELEFMAFLLGLERAAVESTHDDRLARRAICRDAQRNFLQEHLVWWVPTFARLLSMQDPGGFYGAVSQFLAALIPVERARAGFSASAGQVAPSTVERPEECSGCLLNL